MPRAAPQTGSRTNTVIKPAITLLVTGTVGTASTPLDRAGTRDTHGAAIEVSLIYLIGKRKSHVEVRRRAKGWIGKQGSPQNNPRGG